MDELHMVREGNHLVPLDEMSSEELARLPLKQQVLVTVRVPRNIRQHRLAWALATKVAEACEWLHDREDAMAWLKIKARHVRYIHDHHNGETQIVPKSIRFAALDQMGFDRVFKRMVYITVSEIIPGLDEEALRAEIESMVGIDPAPPVSDPPAKPVRPRRRTAAARDPAPVSVIPDDKNPDPPSPPPAKGNAAAPPKATTKGVAPNENPGTPAPPPPSAPDHAAVQAAPKDAAGWAAYTLAWLADFECSGEKTDQSAMVRWNGERDLRNACGVTSEERQPVFEAYSATLERMRARSH